MYKLFLVLALATVAAARRSANANYIEQLNEEGAEFSNDILEDALLDVPGLIEKYGYPVEVHKVVTADQYVLEAQRILHGKYQNSQPDPNKPAVLLMHGLLSSSADFLITGPGRALAYLLAEAGYDVWLGNARGNYYSRENLVLNPDDRRNQEFWDFSWEEIGSYDLPAFIDYILELNGQSKIHYVGHSQGGTAFLTLTSLQPEYNDKIQSFHGMAPAAFFIHNKDVIMNFLSTYEAPLEAILYTLGFAELFGNRAPVTWVGFNICDEGAILHDLCSSLLLGSDPDYVNGTIIPVILGHSPAGSSTRQISHYAQLINSHEFRRFDHLPIKNIELYGRPVPPSYDLSLITAPSHLYYSLADIFTDFEDILLLSEKMSNVVGVHQMERATFTHVDFTWGVDAKEQLYDNIISHMQQHDASNK